MKIYLNVCQEDLLSYKVSVSETPLSPANLVEYKFSALQSICNLDQLPRLVAGSRIVFLFAKSPREALPIIGDIGGKDLYKNAFFSHGLANIVFLLSGEEDLSFLEKISSQLYAYEVWEIEKDGLLKRSSVEISIISDVVDIDFYSPLDDSGLDIAAAAQVRQFNSNLQQLICKSKSYCSSFIPLLESLYIAAGVALNDATDTGPDVNGHKAMHKSVSELVEINSALSLLASQGFSSTPSILDSRYPVSEYSLLGVGSCLRAIWRVSKHLSDVFAESGEVERIVDLYENLEGFEPYAINRASFSLGEWVGHTNESCFSHLEKTLDDEERVPPYQIPYFSSRWGFHSTLHTISVSWQCIHASALKEWNLLTISHEFLHSHVHKILYGLFPETEDELIEVCELWERHQSVALNQKQSCLLSLLSFLVVRDLFNDSNREYQKQLAKGRSPEVRRTIPEKITPDKVKGVVRTHWDYLNEIIVHILDYLYFYEDDDDIYISSLWHSWSLVPKVSIDLEHYLLRTLCALGATVPRGFSGPEAFEDCLARFKTSIAKVSEANIVASTALEFLNEEAVVTELRTEFYTNWQLICLTREFLYSPKIRTALLEDNATAFDSESGGRYYPYIASEFSGDPIESPVGFLFDRFKYDPSRNDTERDSLWQLLMIVDGD